MSLVSGLFIADAELRPAGPPGRRTRRDLADADMDLTRLAVDAGQFINRAVQVKKIYSIVFNSRRVSPVLSFFFLKCLHGC